MLAYCVATALKAPEVYVHEAATEVVLADSDRLDDWELELLVVIDADELEEPDDCRLLELLVAAGVDELED